MQLDKKEEETLSKRKEFCLNEWMICACIIVIFSAAEVYSFKMVFLLLVVNLFSLSIILGSNVTFPSFTERAFDSVQQ